MGRNNQRDRDQQHDKEEQAAKPRDSEEDRRLEIACEHLLDFDLGELNFLLHEAHRVLDRYPSQIDEATPAVAVGRACRLRGRSPGSRIHNALLPSLSAAERYYAANIIVGMSAKLSIIGEI